MKLIDTRRSYYLLVAVATVGMTLLYALSPLQADDFWYLMTSSSASGPWEAMKSVWQECVRHWTFDTGRLANLVNAPFLTVIPKWVFALLCGTALVVVFHYTRWLADASSRSMRAFLVVVLIIFALPWHDYMFSVVFSLNYLWTSALVLFAVRRILSDDQGRRHGRLSFASSLMLCFAAGWMHEGFSVPVISGLVAYFIVMRRIPARQSLWLIISFAAGALLIAVAPGFWERTGTSETGLCRRTSLEAIMFGSVSNCLYYAFAVFAAITLLRRSKRERISRHPSDMARLVFLLVSTTVATVLFFAFYGGMRMGWIGQLFSGAGILFCCRFYRSNLRHRLKSLLIAVMILLTGCHLAYAIDWQIRLTREFNEIKRLYTASPDGVLFYDVTPSRLDASLLKPSFRQFNEKFPIQQFSYYFGPDKPDLVLIPKSLMHVRREEASLTVDPRLVICHGNILATDTLTAPNPRVEVRINSGVWLPSRSRSVQFADTTGTRYTLIIPHIRFISPDLVIENARLVGF